MILKVRLTELLVNKDTKLYRKFFLIDRGTEVLYVSLQKSLYGLMHSDLLFYLELETGLKKMVSS